MSTILISFWVTLIWLLHPSVTLYVRMTVSVHPSVTGGPSLTHATTGTPQLSASSVTTSGSGTGKVLLHPVRTISAGLEAVGACVSTILISFWVTLIWLLHPSVTLYVRMTVSVHPSVTGGPSLTHATTGTPQLSASSVTTSGSGAGKVLLHPVRTISAGLEAVGGWSSITV